MSIGALLDPPSYLEAAKVFDMLLALPKVGSVKATTRGARRAPEPVTACPRDGERPPHRLAVERILLVTFRLG